MTDSQILESYTNAMTIPIYYTDGVKWPFKSGIILKPVVAEYGKYYTNLFDKTIGSDTFDSTQLPKIFQNAQQLMRCSHHFINGMKAMGLEPNEIATRLLNLAKAIITLQGGRNFIKYGNYLVRDNIEVAPKLNTPLLLALATALWAYSETLYFVHRQTACEYHGNYALKDDNNAIIRDFCNLKPTDLWNEFDFTNIPDTICIKTAHNPSFSCEFDSYNNLYVRAGSMLQSLEYGEVLVDGRTIDEQELTNLLDLISTKIGEFHAIIESMGDIAIKHKYLDIFWYRGKAMANLLGIDWRPTAEIHAKADVAFNTPEPLPSYKPKVPYDEFKRDFDFAKYL
ncbi:MAG: hypothetical protein LBM38_03115 [Clostridiales bacterium]|jgi:hypothetical protein|nr:hypothetical protein [Clostridiales bacterium]